MRVFMKILLACNAGMSTSMLVTRMEKAAAEQGISVEIQAVPISMAIDMVAEWDVIMLGPQVRHQLKQLQNKVNGAKPITVIDMRDYGMMNGANVLKSAIKAIEEHNK